LHTLLNSVFHRIRVKAATSLRDGIGDLVGLLDLHRSNRLRHGKCGLWNARHHGRCDLRGQCRHRVSNRGGNRRGRTCIDA
jgi:hypothetical protein